MRTLILAGALALGVIWGCAGAGSGGSGPGPSNRNLITREQLDAIPSNTAYEAVERLRRQWLLPRAGTMRNTTAQTLPAVFMDGRNYGALDALHQINIEIIHEIRFINAADATTRHGTGYPAGIIEVITRRDDAVP